MKLDSTMRPEIKAITHERPTNADLPPSLRRVLVVVVKEIPCHACHTQRSHPLRICTAPAENVRLVVPDSRNSHVPAETHSARLGPVQNSGTFSPLPYCDYALYFFSPPDAVGIQIMARP